MSAGAACHRFWKSALICRAARSQKVRLLVAHGVMLKDIGSSPPTRTTHAVCTLSRLPTVQEVGKCPTVGSAPVLQCPSAQVHAAWRKPPTSDHIQTRCCAGDGMPKCRRMECSAVTLLHSRTRLHVDPSALLGAHCRCFCRLRSFDEASETCRFMGSKSIPWGLLACLLLLSLLEALVLYACTRAYLRVLCRRCAFACLRASGDRNTQYFAASADLVHASCPEHVSLQAYQELGRRPRTGSRTGQQQTHRPTVPVTPVHIQV